MRLAPPLPLPHSLAAHAAVPPYTHNWPVEAAAEAGSTSADAFAAASVILADGTLDTLSAVAGAGVTAVAGATAVALLVAVGALGSWLAWTNYVLGLRNARRGRAQQKAKSVPASSAAYVRPRKLWRLDELRAFDGTSGADGPILLAADGLVYNVALARNFYGPDGEYAAMAGTDATRMLARNSLEAETDATAPLNLAEQASLAAWKFSFERKYDCVGRLANDEEAAALREEAARRKEYYDKMEEIGQVEEDRERIRSLFESDPVESGFE